MQTPTVSSSSSISTTTSEEAQSGAERAKEPRRVRLRRFLVNLPVGLPELGYGVMEACTLPLLLKLEVPPLLLSLNWVFSPLLGLVLHPVLGRACDRYGRRPFVLLLGSVAAVSLAILPVVIVACREAGGLVAFLAVFTAADMCLDLLPTPTRAALNDVYSPQDGERRAGLAGGSGSLLALALVVSLGAEAAFGAVALAVFLVTLTQLLVRREEPRFARNAPCEATPSIGWSAAREPVGDVEGGEAPRSGADKACGGSLRSSAAAAHKFPPGFASVWLASCGGAFLVNMLSFGTTSAWAERSGAAPGTPEHEHSLRVGCAIVMGGTVMFFFSGGVLPLLVRVLGGPDSALLSAIVAMILTMASFTARCPGWLTAALLVVVFPPADQIVCNVPFAWLEMQPSFSAGDRGRLIGWLNSATAVGQILASVFMGPVVVAASGRFEDVGDIFLSFAAASVVCALMVACILLSSCCYRAWRVRA